MESCNTIIKYNKPRTIPNNQTQELIYLLIVRLQIIVRDK